MELNDIISRFCREYGYSQNGASLVAERLLQSAPQVKSAFEAWFSTGELPNLKVEDYSIERLIGEYSMKLPAAFLTMDSLIRNPEKAKKTLERGFDRIIVSNDDDEK